MKVAYIYGLIDPATRELRYVGKCSRSPAKRLGDHMNAMRNRGDRTRRGNWLRSLDRRGLRPEVEVLEQTTPEQAVTSECWWIAYFRFIGCELTNLTNGGDGAPGRIISEETRQRMSAKARGRRPSSDTRAKMSAVRRGRSATWNIGRRYKRDPEVTERIAAAHRGMKRSAETRARLAASNMRPDRIAQLVERNRSPEMRAAVRASWARRKSAVVIERGI